MIVKESAGKYIATFSRSNFSDSSVLCIGLFCPDVEGQIQTKNMADRQIEELARVNDMTIFRSRASQQGTVPRAGKPDGPFLARAQRFHDLSLQVAKHT